MGIPRIMTLEEVGRNKRLNNLRNNPDRIRSEEFVEWIWNVVVQRGSQTYFELFSDFINVHFITTNSSNGMVSNVEYVLFQLNLHYGHERIAREKSIHTVLDALNITTLIRTYDQKESSVVHGINNIKKEIIQAEEIENSLNNPMFLINNPKTFYNYKNNKRILSSCVTTHEKIVGGTTGELLQMKNLNDVMMFYIIKNQKKMFISDLWCWDSKVVMSSMNIFSCLEHYETDHIIFVDKNSGSGINFLYKKLHDKYSYSKLVQKLDKADSYIGIIYNPIFFNTIDSVLRFNQNKLESVDMDSLRIDIRKAMSNIAPIIKYKEIEK